MNYYILEDLKKSKFYFYQNERFKIYNRNMDLIAIYEIDFEDLKKYQEYLKDKKEIK